MASFFPALLPAFQVFCLCCLLAAFLRQRCRATSSWFFHHGSLVVLRPVQITLWWHCPSPGDGWRLSPYSANCSRWRQNDGLEGCGGFGQPVLPPRSPRQSRSRVDGSRQKQRIAPVAGEVTGCFVRLGWARTDERSLTGSAEDRGLQLGSVLVSDRWFSSSLSVPQF